MNRRWMIFTLCWLGALASTGCLRESKQSKLLTEIRESTSKIAPPKPPLAVKPEQQGPISLADHRIPKLDIKPGPMPPMPGLPGTASRPMEISTTVEPNVFLTARAKEDKQRKGIVRRLIDRIRDREKTTVPELPPALEKQDPVQEKHPERKPELPKALAEPPQSIPDSPTAKALELQPAQAKPSETGDLKTARTLVDAASKKFKATPDFESKLTKRETVAGKKQPTEAMRFLFRQEPFSVRLIVTGEAGRGREVLYVKGQKNDKLTIITGEGDNRLVGAGFKITLEKDDPRATARTRGKIDESGLGRPIRILTKFVDDAEAGKREAKTVRSLGLVQRKEFKSPLAGVEVTLKPGDDALLPKGGRRQYYFDADEKSPSYQLPVLVLTYEPNDVEVEYFLFTDFILPAKLSDADFDPAKLGKKK